MISDKLSDFLIRLKNGYRAKKSSVFVCNTVQIRRLLVLLLKLGYISSFSIIDIKNIQVSLRYLNNLPAIREIKRISKPSSKIYIKVVDLKNRSSLSGNQNGFLIMSTSFGFITDIEALANGVGGEVLFSIF